jgi:hypothetical protein
MGAYTRDAKSRSSSDKRPTRTLARYRVAGSFEKGSEAIVVGLISHARDSLAGRMEHPSHSANADLHLRSDFLN